MKKPKIRVYKEYGDWTWELLNTPNCYASGTGPTYSETKKEAMKEAQAYIRDYERRL